MREQARKVIELHELMNSHDWIPVSKSFQVCKCGMCRGSNSAFNSRQTRRQRRWGHQSAPTDWVTLSEMRTMQKWVQHKMIWADRIKDYLVQFPFWAGHYGQKTGNAELIEVMKRDDEFLLDYALKANDFSPEIEARMRSNISRLQSFLTYKKRHEGVERMQVSEESRMAIIVNGDSYAICWLAKMEGPKDDTRTAILEADNGERIVEYAYEVDGQASDICTKALLQHVNPKDSSTLSRIATYVRHFGLERHPELTSALFSSPYGAKEWLRIVKRAGVQTPIDVATTVNYLVKEKAANELTDLLRDNVCTLTPEITEICCTLNWGGDSIPVPKGFDRKTWNVLIKNKNSGWGMSVLVNWKRALRDRWTADISRLEHEIKSLKAAGKSVEAKIKSKECSALKVWAHGLLVDYKKVISSGD